MKLSEEGGCDTVKVLLNYRLENTYILLRRGFD